MSLVTKFKVDLACKNRGKERDAQWEEFTSAREATINAECDYPGCPVRIEAKISVETGRFEGRVGYGNQRCVITNKKQPDRDLGPGQIQVAEEQ